MGSGPAFLGLDIGGFAVKGLRLEPGGLVSRRASRPTPSGEGASALLAALRDLVAELLEPGPAAAAGVGTPGAVDSRGRIASDAVNIPSWRGAELGAALSSWIGAPAVVRNDGNMAAYGEWAARRGSSRALLFVGLGTGLGGGYVEEGRILGGVDDRAVEIGHVVVRPGGRPCACGRSGCAEAYASGPAVARIAAELAPLRSSPLALELRETSCPPDPRLVCEGLSRGDELAREAFAEAADALAQAVAAAMALLAPDRVVLGGGLLEGAPGLVESVADLVPTYLYEAAWRGCRFERALLGAGAGALGAALVGAAAVLGREGHERLLADAVPLPAGK